MVCYILSEEEFQLIYISAKTNFKHMLQSAEIVEIKL